MDKQNIGILILCLFVFIILVISFYLLISTLIKSIILNIRNGSDDESILKEKDTLLNHKTKSNISDKILTIISTIIIVIAVISTGYLFITKDKPVNNIPLLKTVESGSMSYKYEEDSYLTENNLNDQIALGDLILIEKMPNKENIELYDIVLYKNKKGQMVLHRIIDINNSNENDTFYIFRGDANPVSDNENVYYNQMYGIYRGKHVPLLGDFAKFLKSPAGILCILLIIVVTFIYPFIDNKLTVYKKERLVELGYSSNEEKVESNVENVHLKDINSKKELKDLGYTLLDIHNIRKK